MRPELILLLAALGAPASAQGLEGRTVLMRGETWDDPAAPFLRSSDYVGVVGPGPEFDFAVETANALSVVPVRIDLGDDRVDLSYEGVAGGLFAEARFNGYVLTFPVECTLLAGAKIDPDATTLPLTDADLKLGPRELRVDVGGLAYGPTDRIGIRLDVMDCPIS